MDLNEAALQLYKLEYEKSAERYDNIYRSMWTIFSYLTAVAAGFLAFGPERIERHALICIAAIPLLFWFWTTYMPLDRYGNEVIKRLGKIECILDRDFKVDLNHFKPQAHKELSVFKGLLRALLNPDSYSPRPLAAGWPKFITRIWSRWERAPKWCHRLFATLRDLWNQAHRARFAIWVLFIVLHLMVFYEWGAFRDSGKPLFLEKPAATRPVGAIPSARVTASSR